MRIPFPLTVQYAAAAVLLALGPAAVGQTLPVVIPPAPNIGPAMPVAPEIRELLKMLHDQKDMLKDFTGKIDYSVADKTGDVTGKRGTVDYVDDPVKGPEYSADFTTNTTEGKPTLKYHVQFIFDGRDFTVKDFGKSNDVRQFVRSRILPEGAKPGDAVSLNGAMTLPIGLDVEDVLRTFDVTQGVSKDANLGVLKLAPKVKGKFNYTQLEVTVDKKLQLPTTLAQTAPDGTVTTITLTDLDINSKKAKVADAGRRRARGGRRGNKDPTHELDTRHGIVRRHTAVYAARPR